MTPAARGPPVVGTLRGMATPDRTIGYATPEAARPRPAARRTASLRLALTCWAVPLLVGVAIYAASEVVRATAPAGAQMLFQHGPATYEPFRRLAYAGLLTIVGGTAATLLGVTAVAVFVATRWSAAVARTRQVIVPAVTVLVLLGSNFVVAAGLLFLGTR